MPSDAPPYDVRLSLARIAKLEGRTTVMVFPRHFSDESNPECSAEYEDIWAPSKASLGRTRRSPLLSRMLQPDQRQYPQRPLVLQPAIQRSKTMLAQGPVTSPSRRFSR